MTTTDGPTGHTYPGRALGLPEDGVGSVASMSRRIGAFVIDIVLSALVAWWITAPEAPGNTSLLVWAVMTVVTVGLFGITPGQAALGIRVVPLRAGGAFVGPRAARPALPHRGAAHPVAAVGDAGVAGASPGNEPSHRPTIPEAHDHDVRPARQRPDARRHGDRRPGRGRRTRHRRGTGHDRSRGRDGGRSRDTGRRRRAGGGRRRDRPHRALRPRPGERRDAARHRGSAVQSGQDRAGPGVRRRGGSQDGAGASGAAGRRSLSTSTRAREPAVCGSAAWFGGAWFGGAWFSGAWFSGGASPAACCAA